MQPGILTHSGEYITADEGVPTVEDISIALARIPRFGGHTCRLWSVADHSRFCLRLAGHDPLVQLAALMHDWHEAITGDVPTPWKDKGLRAAQEKFDTRIIRTYFPAPWTQVREAVKDIDRRALLAEAHVVGPVRCAQPSVMLKYFGGMPMPADVELLQDTLLSEPVGPMFVSREYSALAPLAVQAWAEVRACH